MSSIAASADISAFVNRIIPFSSVDGPGNRTAVFLQGCNFACSYCHNPETIRFCVHCGKCVKKCPAGALEMRSGKVIWHAEKCCGCDNCIHACTQLASPKVTEMSVSEVLTAIRANMPFIRGVTVSGGECTLQRDFCLALARGTRELGLNFLLDSNGSYDFSSDLELTDAIDGVMLDVKARDRALHNALTGRDNDTVLKNLSFLADIGKLEEVRVVIVPGINDPEAVIDHVCGVLVSSRPDTRFKIIRYRPMGVREPYRSSFLSPDDALMNSLVERAHALGIRNTIVL